MCIMFCTRSLSYVCLGPGSAIAYLSERLAFLSWNDIPMRIEYREPHVFPIQGTHFANLIEIHYVENIRRIWKDTEVYL